MEPYNQNINPPNTIYNDLQKNPNFVPQELNNIDGGYNSQSNDIYSAIPPNNLGYPQSSGNLYSQASGNIYSSLENNQGLAPQPNPNIYIQPEIQPGLAPKLSEDNLIPSTIQINLQPQLDSNNYIPPENNSELPPQANPNIYIQPENNNQIVIPPMNDINSEYAPQQNPNNNPAYLPQLNEEITVQTTNMTPINVESSSLPSASASIPLISPTNEIKVGGNCCTRIDETQVELDSFVKNFIIALGVILVISGIVNIILSLLIETDYFNIVASIDIAFIIFGIIVALSTFRVKCLRVIATVFSVIYVIAGIIGSIMQYAMLDDKRNDRYDFNDNIDSYIEICGYITLGRIIWFILNLNVLFNVYWGIKCCCRGRDSSGTYHSYNTDYTYDSGPTYHTHHTHIHSTHHHSAAHHHHSAPHHRSAPHRSAPHRSAPHHAPHRSAPHHAPHRSAPHHSAHHGGRRRH